MATLWRNSATGRIRNTVFGFRTVSMSKIFRGISQRLHSLRPAFFAQAHTKALEVFRGAWNEMVASLEVGDLPPPVTLAKSSVRSQCLRHVACQSPQRSASPSSQRCGPGASQAAQRTTSAGASRQPGSFRTPFRGPCARTTFWSRTSTFSVAERSGLNLRSPIESAVGLEASQGQTPV